jgi:hypothetical protein
MGCVAPGKKNFPLKTFIHLNGMYVGTQRFSSCKCVSTGKRNCLDRPIEIIADFLRAMPDTKMKCVGQNTVHYVKFTGIK